MEDEKGESRTKEEEMKKAGGREGVCERKEGKRKESGITQEGNKEGWRDRE